MRASDILERGAEWLSRNGLHQGDFAWNGGLRVLTDEEWESMHQPPTRCCAIGACAVASGLLPGQVQRAISEACGDQAVVELTQFNDAPGRRKGEVVARMRRMSHECR